MESILKVCLCAGATCEVGNWACVLLADCRVYDGGEESVQRDAVE